MPDIVDDQDVKISYIGDTFLSPETRIPKPLAQKESHGRAVIYNVNNEETSMFAYKGYKGQIELEDNYFCGRVLGINDVVTFKGKTIEEAHQEFQNSVDDYLDFCKELGQEPDYSEENDDKNY